MAKKRRRKQERGRAKEERKETKKIKVNWVLCLILSVLFGSLGVDRYVMGKVGTGILKLITFGGLGIWWLVDVVLIATKHEYKGVKWVG
jgi:TM2 domain-containing membrane protein YozV